MIPSRTLSVATILAAIGVLAATPATAGAQGLFEHRGSFSFGDVAFPAVADTFAVIRAERYQEPALGVHLQYATPLDPSASSDIYVYPVDDDGLEGEFRDAVQGIVVYAERNREGVTATIDTTRAVTIADAGGRTHEGWVAVARFERRGAERPSFLYLFEKDGHYLKYRLTHAAPLRLRLEPHIAAFLAETLATIAPDDGESGRSR